MEELIEEYLYKYFKLAHFRPNQKEIILSVLRGHDVFVKFPTGMGKSLCYQLPATIMDGITIVVSPLISLMKDQVDSLINKGISATYLNSTIIGSKREEIISNCISGKIKILYISPEGFLKEYDCTFRKMNISLFAIDEAHSINQWGYDFRPEYRQLSLIKEQFPEIPVMALTASATENTKRDILNLLHIESALEFSSTIYRENIRLSVKCELTSRQKIESIIQLYNKYQSGSGIVFCNTRRIASSVANKLKYRNVNAVSYHAGLTPKERNEIQDEYMSGKIDVVCATIAFGMGIDKPDIRWVVHYNVPQSIENYYQEFGRAGRDGHHSEAILFYNTEDLTLIERFALNSGNIDTNIHKIDCIKEYSLTNKCRWDYIIRYFQDLERPHDCKCDNCLNSLQ